MSLSYMPVFEFGYLCADEKMSAQLGFTFICRSDFNYLEKCGLTEGDSDFSMIIQPRMIRGCRVLQLKSYVGVIFVPSGRHIEVLPKIGKHDNVTDRAIIESRQSLLIMLQSLREFRHLELDQVNVDTLKLPLLEILIGRFLSGVNHIVKRGLRCDYVGQENNLNVKRGKLNVGKQVRYNSIEKQRFYCEYDEYMQDRPANRLLKSAMLKVATYTVFAANQKLLRELLFAFDAVPVSHNIAQDLANQHLDRGMSYYQSALGWARLILNDLSPVTMQGQQLAPSLLFPMESVFEAFVAQILQQQLPSMYQLHTQASQHSLVSHNNHNMFKLKPDLLIKQNQKACFVLDTKWKCISSNNELDNYGLSQADFYQMFAYGHKYLGGDGEIYLIYPASVHFNQPIALSFDYSSVMKVWVVPFHIRPQGKSFLMLPEGGALKI